MKIKPTYLPASAVLTGLLMGATTHSTTNAVLSSIGLLGRVSTTIKLIFAIWLFLSVTFVAGSAIWISRLVQGQVPTVRFALIVWATTLPSVSIARESFTVLPFVLNLNVDFGAVRLGFNFVAVAALTLVMMAVRRERSENVQGEGKPWGELDASEYQVEGR